MRKVDPAGCEVHLCGGGLDSAACRGWEGVREGGEGDWLWEECWGQRGENNGVTKAAFSIHVAGVKREYRRAKLSGARYFDVSGKFESFWRLKL